MENSGFFSLLTKALSSAHIGVWFYDHEKQSVYFNEAMFDVYQIQPDRDAAEVFSFCGEKESFYRVELEELGALIFAEDKGAFLSALEACVSGKQSLKVEARIVNELGKVLNLNWYVSPSNIRERGHQIDLIGCAIDSTSSVQEQVQYDLIIEATNVGTWQWHVPTGHVVFNERWAQMLGFTLEELAPITLKTWEMLTHPEELKKTFEILQKVFRKEQASYKSLMRMRHKEGHWVWILAQGTVTMWDEQGAPILMHGTHQDFDEFVKLQEKLQSHAMFLDEIGTFAKIGGWQIEIVNGELQKPFWSVATKNIHEVPLDYEPDIQTAINFFHPDDRQVISELVKKVLDTKEPYDVELRVVTHLGRLIWVRATGRLYTNEKGESVRLAGTFQDISEQKSDQIRLKKVSLELQEANKKLLGENIHQVQTIKELSIEIDEQQKILFEQQNMATLGSVIAGVAHELNNPIGNTLLLAQTLKEELHQLLNSFTGEPTKIQRSHVMSAVQKTIEINDALVSNCLNSTQLIASFKNMAFERAHDTKRSLNVGEFLLQQFKTLKASYYNKPWVFVLNSSPESIWVNTYPGLISQILQNLISNCVLHGFSGRQQGTITIGAHATAKGAVISVQDDGVGVTETVAKKIFTPYFTTKLGQGGFGLGLHLAREMAQQGLGGDLTFASGLLTTNASAQSKGTTFYLHIASDAPNIDKKNASKNKFQNPIEKYHPTFKK